MKRLFSLILVCMMIAGATYTFEVKRRAEEAAAEAQRLAREIEREKDDIELLKADISVLSQPNRLQELTDTHQDMLQLQPLRVDQIISLDELPKRPIDLTPLEGDDQLGGYAGSSDTNIQ